MFTCVGACTVCELLQHFVQLVMRCPAILRAERCPRVAAVVMVIVITVALSITVFVVVMAVVMAVVVFVVILIITVGMVPVGDRCGMMQQLLLQGGDLPPQQLLQRGGVRCGRVLRLTTQALHLKHLGCFFLKISVDIKNKKKRFSSSRLSSTSTAFSNQRVLVTFQLNELYLYLYWSFGLSGTCSCLSSSHLQVLQSLL